MLIKYLIIFGISMVPLIELRGAIPVGAGMGLLPVPNYLVSALGNILPLPFILIFVKLVLEFMKKRGILVRLVEWIERKAIKGAAKIQKDGNGDAPSAAINVDGRRVKMRSDASARRKELGALLGLFLFVALPLPGTGAWTGGLVAALLSMNRWKSFLAILAGVLVAGLIMSLASYGVLGALKFLL